LLGLTHVQSAATVNQLRENGSKKQPNQGTPRDNARLPLSLATVSFRMNFTVEVCCVAHFAKRIAVIKAVLYSHLY
jgi:hypothetical protein